MKKINIKIGKYKIKIIVSKIIPKNEMFFRDPRDEYYLIKKIKEIENIKSFYSKNNFLIFKNKK
jgi:hypothetical protein